MSESINKSADSARLMGLFTKLTIAGLFSSFVLPLGDVFGAIVLIIVIGAAVAVVVFLLRYLFFKIQERKPVQKVE